MQLCIHGGTIKYGDLGVLGGDAPEQDSSDKNSSR